MDEKPGISGYLLGLMVMMVVGFVMGVLVGRWLL
jgi:hypothetical protein